ncbi:MAG: hypothetical protein U1A27_09750 [Phycisphaerae bacterium]
MTVSIRRPWLALLLALPLVAPSGARAADAAKTLLEAIPADAWGFIAIPSLEGLEGKFTKLGKQLGLPVPPMVNMAQAQLGLSEGLDTKGPLAFVFLDMKRMQHGGMMLLLPVTDGDKVIAKLKMGAPAKSDEGDEEGDKKGKDAAAEDDSDGIVRCGLMGQPAFAAKLKKFVVLGSSRAACAMALKAKSSAASALESQRQAAFEHSDLFISFAAATVIDAYQDQIKGMLGMMAMAAGPQAGAGMGQLDQLIKMLGEVGSCDLCLEFGDAGLKLVGLGTPKPKSDLATALKKQSPKAKSLLSPLAKDRFIFSVGSVGQRAEEKDIEQAVQTMMGALQAKEKIDEKKVKALTGDLTALARSTQGSAFSVSVLPDGPDGIVGASLVLHTDDGAAVVERLGKIVAQVKELSDADEFKHIVGAVTHKPGAEDVGGGKVDHLTVDLKKLAEDMEENEAESLHKVLGKDGITLRFGAVGKDHVVMTFGGGKEQFARAAQAAQSDSGGLSGDAGITSVGKHLPAEKTAEFFFSLDSLLDCVSRVMTAVGEDDNIPFKLSKELNAPVGGSTTVDHGSARLDIFVPMELITAVKNGVMAAQAGEDDEGDSGEAKPAGKKPVAKGDAAHKPDADAKKPDKKKSADDDDD